MTFAYRLLVFILWWIGWTSGDGVLSMREMMQRNANRRESRRIINDDICLSSACYFICGGLDGPVRRCSEHARDDAEKRK
jgi:hypothetical protein